MGSFLDRTIFVLITTIASYPLAIGLGSAALLPAFNALSAFLVMVGALRRQRVAEAILLMLVWAATMGACATWLAYRDPPRASAIMLNAASYREEMFAWLASGVGRESDPSRFVPQHLLHVGVFAGLAGTSGGALAMPMGAVLMNYMGAYVGSLANASPTPVLTTALAWSPWALIRIVSFIVIGTVLSGPMLSRALKFPFRLRDHRRLLLVAGVGLVLDIVLKWTLAPAWRELVRRAAGWE